MKVDDEQVIILVEKELGTEHGGLLDTTIAGIKLRVSEPDPMRERLAKSI